MRRRSVHPPVLAVRQRDRLPGRPGRVAGNMRQTKVRRPRTEVDFSVQNGSVDECQIEGWTGYPVGKFLPDIRYPAKNADPAHP